MPANPTVERNTPSVPRLTLARNANVERMIRSNLLQDLAVQMILFIVCVLWFSNRWIWVLWGIRWCVVAAMLVSWRTVRMGYRSRALLVLAGGHIAGVVGLVAIVPVLTPLAMVIIVGDLFMVSYLDEVARRRYFATVIAVPQD